MQTKNNVHLSCYTRFNRNTSQNNFARKQHQKHQQQHQQQHLFETELPSERNEVTEQNCLKMCHPIQNNNNNNNRHHILQVLTTTKNS